jgi:hypothetical protein
VQNKTLLIVPILALSISCKLMEEKSTASNSQKKYPVNIYLDSLIRNSHLVQITEIISKPEVSNENGNTIFTFTVKHNSDIKNYPFAAVVSYPFTSFTTNVRYIVSENDQTTISWLKKGNTLIFFAKAIQTGVTSISYDCLDIIGFVKPTKNNIYYIQHTFKETKSNVVLSLYHTDKKPRRDKNYVGHKEHYWTYYENGNIQRERIRINKRSILHLKNEKGKKHWKLFCLTHKDLTNYYYENGIPKEKIVTKYKFEKKNGDKITSYDTTKFDTTGKIIYQIKHIIKSNIYNYHF